VALRKSQRIHWEPRKNTLDPKSGVGPSVLLAVTVPNSGEAPTRCSGHRAVPTAIAPPFIAAPRSCRSSPHSGFPRSAAVTPRRRSGAQESRLAIAMATDKDTTLLQRLWLAGASNCCAAAISHPLDTLKVQLQILGEGSPLKPPPATTVLRQLVQTHGVLNGIYRGLFPSLLREATYSAMRLGFYEPAKQLFGAGDPSAPFALRLCAGLLSGSVAAAIANPTDLLKVRQQAASRKRLNPGTSNQILETAELAATIFRNEGGTRALWQGVGPNAQRAALLTASQLGTYDQAKASVKAAGWLQEGLALHVVASMTAGLAAALVTSPVDLAKTRIMNQRQRLAAVLAAAAPGASPSAGGVVVGSSSLAGAAAVSRHGALPPLASSALAPAALHTSAHAAAPATTSASAALAAHAAAAQGTLYKSTLDCLVKTARTEGLLGLYSGFSQQFLRLGPHTIVTFIVYERLRQWVGMRPV